MALYARCHDYVWFALGMATTASRVRSCSCGRAAIGNMTPLRACSAHDNLKSSQLLATIVHRDQHPAFVTKVVVPNLWQQGFCSGRQQKLYYASCRQRRAHHFADGCLYVRLAWYTSLKLAWWIGWNRWNRAIYQGSLRCNQRQTLSAKPPLSNGQPQHMT